MKRLLMLGSHRGSPNGIEVHMYHEGQEYDLPPYLADIFLKEGWAKIVVPKQPAPVLEPQSEPTEVVKTEPAEQPKVEVADTPKKEYAAPLKPPTKSR